MKTPEAKNLGLPNKFPLGIFDQHADVNPSASQCFTPVLTPGMKHLFWSEAAGLHDHSSPGKLLLQVSLALFLDLLWYIMVSPRG